MPCNSDYLEASSREKETQQAAQFFVNALIQLGKPVPEWLYQQSHDYYASDQRIIPQFCHFLKNLTPEQNQKLFGERTLISTRIECWWLEHQEQDRKREKREAEEAAKVEEDLAVEEFRENYRKGRGK